MKYPNEYPNTIMLNTANGGPIVATTNGRGLWSETKRTTHTRRLKLWLDSINDGNGLLVSVQAYFPRKEWNTKRDGLIYTDEGWLSQFRRDFNNRRFVKGLIAQRNLDYTEQGMQGEDYVSLEFDIKGKSKIKEFCKRIAVDYDHFIQSGEVICNGWTSSQALAV